MSDTNEYARYTEDAAIALLGEPSDKRGNEWRYGTNGSLSIDVETGRWYDHENEVGGGPLDLIMREAGRDTVSKAISWLEEQGMKEREQPKQTKQPKKQAKVVEAYDYTDENGEILFQVTRLEPKSFRQRKPDGNGGWSWSVKGVRQVPYRLPEIIQRSGATILIVEGEKDADRLAELGFLATCNAGGAGKWPKSLIPFFQSRRVVMLPDNDDAGRKHVRDIAPKLKEVAESVRVADLPGLPDKGDVSDWLDAGGTVDELKKLCKEAPEWEPEPEPEQEKEQPKPEPSGMPFRPLGYNQGKYYYLSRGAEQVEEVKRGSHTSAAEMLGLAPIEWWEMAYPGPKGGVDWQAAASDLMRRCEERGIYTPDRERGRGAWYDQGHSVLHLGTRLVVDGTSVPIADHESHYIYTRQKAMETGMQSEPASDQAASEVLDIFDRLNWSREIHAKLVAGWTMLAPICGALPWRPHIWITSQRGAGKSWVQDHVIGPLLGQSALRVQGSTTEAGIRQALQQDARPIVFDEAESEDHRSQQRMQTVIELARQASSESSAEIFKGTATGGGMAFRMRSMFLMGSINVSLSQAADESRFSVVSLEPPDKSQGEIERFKEFEAYVDSRMGADFCASIRARAYQLMPVIRTNASVLTQAVAETVHSQRVGDQIGTILAGTYALLGCDSLTLEEARDWVSTLDFEEAREAEQVSDEQNCLNAIMQSQVRAENSEGKVLNRSMAELVQIAAGQTSAYELGRDSANRACQRYGVRVIDSGEVAISNTHAEIKRLLRDTPWGTEWRRILSRLPGAHSPPNTPWFAGTKTRATVIPIECIG